MRRFGVCLSSLALVAATGCIYGFSQGGLPSNIRTIAVLPFDNQTSSPEITRELYDEMSTELKKRLGLRDASQDRADAIVRGTIVSYDADVPVGFSSNPSQAEIGRASCRERV